MDMIYLLIIPAAFAGGFAFYWWRGNYSLDKYHKNWRAKRTSLHKLYYGLLSTAGLLAIIAFITSLYWGFEWQKANLCAAPLCGFVLGAMCCSPFIMSEFHRRFPRGSEDDDWKNAA
jgi:hypothetical protein